MKKSSSMMKDDAQRYFIPHAQINATSKYEAIEWIPYDIFKDIKEIAKGGFGEIYKVTWIDGLMDRL
ncbi:hypothetical protein Glove_151g110 [Diversispora epigaea]|uniref:Protein kinase domain-containing protein n=1 Tax=Diversispora epigaea TaxID=1348612 RepID=A0A397IT86_9GLOM|nr:hypothetical protein Glove_151g110 [Diversispora epigaea]